MLNFDLVFDFSANVEMLKHDMLLYISKVKNIFLVNRISFKFDNI